MKSQRPQEKQVSHHLKERCLGRRPISTKGSSKDPVLGTGEKRKVPIPRRNVPWVGKGEEGLCVRGSRWLGR